MQNAARPVRRVQRKNALATVDCSHTGKETRRALQGAPMNTDVPKSRVNQPVTAESPTLRTSPAVQTQIIRLYLAGHNFVEIARQLHRDRRTVAKICRLPDVQAKVREIREKLLAESDDWAESINFAVRHETDGRLAYRLLKAFGAIPNPEKKVPIGKQNSFE